MEQSFVWFLQACHFRKHQLCLFDCYQIRKSLLCIKCPFNEAWGNMESGEIIKQGQIVQLEKIHGSMFQIRADIKPGQNGLYWPIQFK